MIPREKWISNESFLFNLENHDDFVETLLELFKDTKKPIRDATSEIIGLILQIHANANSIKNVSHRNVDNLLKKSMDIVSTTRDDNKITPGINGMQVNLIFFLSTVVCVLYF